MPKDKKKHGKKAEAKQLKKLQRREAELAAELAEREAAEAKAAKKAAKKAKQHPVVEAIATTDLDETDADVSDGALFDGPDEGDDLDGLDPERIDTAASKVLADPNATEGARKSAEKAKARVQAERKDVPESVDAAIKERVQRKAEARKALDELDRSDWDAVRAFNETHGKVLGHFATAEGEVEETIAKMDRRAQHTASNVEEVQTETGRVFEAGAAVIDDELEKVITEANADPIPASEQPTAADARGFALPSEARGDFETNGNGQYKVQRPSDGKIVGYTRTTTFIDAIDDKTTLTDWKLRTLLEGIVANEDDVVSDPTAPLLMSRVRDLLHRRDTELAKARKKDRKGKLVVGQLATLESAAFGEFKRGMNEVVEALLERGGVHEKANKGTDLHRLCQLYNEVGIDAVGDLLTAGTITPADMADIEAYARALDAAGIKVLENEVMVVNDEAKRAGRLDLILMARLPGSKRATRMVADIKTGSIDYGTKIPMQLEAYASSQGYDPEKPSERRDLRLSRTKALLIHLPQGQAECHIYVVDLGTGRVGNGIATQVRKFRNDGKRGIDKTVDLATGIALEPTEGEED